MEDKPWYSSVWTWIIGLPALLMTGWYAAKNNWFGGNDVKASTTQAVDADAAKTAAEAEAAAAAEKAKTQAAAKEAAEREAATKKDAEDAQNKQNEKANTDANSKITVSGNAPTTNQLEKNIVSVVGDGKFASFLVKSDGQATNTVQTGAMLVSGYSDGNNFIVTKAAIAGDDGKFPSDNGNMQFIKLHKNVKLNIADNSLDLNDNEIKKAIVLTREFVANEQKSLAAKIGGAAADIAVASFHGVTNKVSQFYKKHNMPTDLGDFAVYESEQISKHFTYPKVQVLQVSNSVDSNEQLVNLQLERIDGTGAIRKYTISGTVNNAEANKFVYVDNITETTDPNTKRTLPADGVAPIFIEFSAAGNKLAAGDALKLDPATTISKIVGELSSRKEVNTITSNANIKLSGSDADEQAKAPIVPINKTNLPQRIT